MSGLFRVDGDAYDNFMGRYSRGSGTRCSRTSPASTAGMRVLDVGAGTGALTAELVARGASVAAADPSPEFVAVLRERFPNLEVEEAPAESLPYGAGVFDLALAQLVVAFVSDGPAAIAEMARVARRVAVCMWGVEEVDMFAAIDRAAEAVGASARDRAAPLPDGAGDPRPARAARRRRDCRAGRDRRLRRLRGVLAGDGPRRRACRAVARIARPRAARAGARRAVPRFRQPTGAVRAERASVRGRGHARVSARGTDLRRVE